MKTTRKLKTSILARPTPFVIALLLARGRRIVVIFRVYEFAQDMNGLHFVLLVRFLAYNLLSKLPLLILVVPSALTACIVLLIGLRRSSHGWHFLKAGLDRGHGCRLVQRDVNLSDKRHPLAQVLGCL